MAHSNDIIRHLMSAFRGDSPSRKRRRTRQMTPTIDGLEDRLVLSHVAGLHHHHAHHATSAHTSTASTASTATTATTATKATAASTSDTSDSGTSSTSSSALQTARQTLRSEIQTIELASGTTIGQLAAIQSAFQTLNSDGLEPSSASALSSFEDSLVKSFANGTTLTGNATLLAQFEALYTTSPTTQETTDLTTAYNALAAAVTSSNITSADLTAIDSDQAAVLSAEGSSSTATFPYFSLVTGMAGGLGYHGMAGGLGYAGGAGAGC
jgi:hypothetical protein